MADIITNYITQCGRLATTAFIGATTAELVVASVAGFIWLYTISLFIFPVTLLSVLAGIVYAYTIYPTVTLLSAFAIFAVYLTYIFWVFKIWERNFSGERLRQHSTACPSNQQLPDVKSFQSNKDRILENSRYHANFDGCELLQTIEEMERTRQENKISRERSKRNVTFNGMGSMGEDRAEELDLDHIYVKFTDFLWGYTFIGPFSFILWKRGTIILRFRKWLAKIGLIHPKCDYEELAATLCLEQTQAIHYYGRTKPGSKLGNIAGFFFTDFPYVDGDCESKIANLFAVDIDLDTKRFVKAKLDNEILNAKEAVILLWFNTISAQHVKLHAMANWGVNLDDSLEEVNSFLRRNSVVTVMYNFFGYSTFNGFMKTWVKDGLASEGWAKPHAPFVKQLYSGFKAGVWQHGQITELVKYSRFVKFVVKVRAIFLSEFQKYKHLFPGVDGEAMFIGTVLHSLDHTLMDLNLKDALFLDTSDPRFGKMAEVGQIVKVGFVSDVDGLYFHKRFKGSGHPFYDSVYEKAAKIDKYLADNMDTCIVK